MQGNKPSWLCRACRDRFNFVCLDQRFCPMDNADQSDPENAADHPYPDTSFRQIDTNKLPSPKR